MIAPSLINEVRRLLAEGRYSQRKIGEMTGVGRGTVNAVARGKRPDYDEPRHTPEDGPEKPTGPPGRCKGCGGIVYMPCRLCRTRKLIGESANSRTAYRDKRPEEPLRLNLLDEHRARYEQVRRVRSEKVREAGC